MAEMTTVQRPYTLLEKPPNYWENYGRMFDESETTYCKDGSSYGITFGFDLPQMPRDHIITGIGVRILYKRKGNENERATCKLGYWHNKMSSIGVNLSCAGRYDTKEWIGGYADIDEDQSGLLMNAEQPCFSYSINANNYSLTYEILIDVYHEERQNINLYVGESRSKAVYVGTTKAKAVYVGTTKVL